MISIENTDFHERHDEGTLRHLVQVQSEELSVCLGSYLGGVEGDRGVGVPGTEAHEVGGSASMRAATRVKPEQASKELMRVSSRHENGEDHRRPSLETEAGGRTRRGIGRGTHASLKVQRERSAEVRTLIGQRAQRLLGSRPEQKSEEPIVVTKPINAGGAKGLWFGVHTDERYERGLA